MADRNENPMDAVSSLLEERQRFESWIATLESRKASTPPHVYARVHADYERRLEEVLERLSGRTGELEDKSRDLRLQIDRLQEEENARRDERAESELRAMVGEFTDDEWTDRRGKSDADIARLSSEVGSLRDELAKLDELLRTATAPRRSQETAAVPPEPVTSAAEAAVADRAVPVVPATEPAPAAQAAREPEAAPARAEAPAAAQSQPAAPPSAPPSRPAEQKPSGERGRGGDPIPDTRAFDELAFLKSVVEPRDSLRGRVPVEPPAERQAAAPAAAAPEPRAEPKTEPRPEPRTEPRPEPRTEPRSGPMGESAAPRTTVPGRRPATPPEPAAAMPPAHVGSDESRAQRESVPSFLRDVPNEQAKTLKCQECGTMNYPTEWYCERCGGELAAM